MTFNVGRVEGGTGAGRKRPLKDAPKHWTCRCKSAKAEAAGAIAEIEHYLELVAAFQAAYPE